LLTDIEFLFENAPTQQAAPAQKKSVKVSFIDPKLAQALAIELRPFASVPPADIAAALSDGDLRGVPSDLFIALQRKPIKPEEAAALAAFGGLPSELGTAEAFLLPIVALADFAPRVDVLRAMIAHGDAVRRVRETVGEVMGGVKALRGCGFVAAFARLTIGVAKILNGGKSSKIAVVKGFVISAELDRLKDLKSVRARDKSLFKFVVGEIRKTNPTLLSAAAEILPSLERATAATFDSIDRVPPPLWL
jgi:hypothetical protein